MASPSELRAHFEAKLRNDSMPRDSFHPSDLEKLETDDAYVQRFIDHCDGDLDTSLEMIWNAFLWRKTSGANEINESNLRMDYINEGAFFPHGRDVNGCRLLVFKCKAHTKGSKDMEELKRCIIYWFNRVEREENGKQLTLFFDMEGCGVSNIDLELIKYLILLVKSYYPNFLNYIIIFEMGWILNGPFKIIKQLLPARGVAKMKNVNRSTLPEFVSPEEALISWGGKNDYEFNFVPSESAVQNVENIKKVTFNDTKSDNDLFEVNPRDDITFKTENGDTFALFTIKNISEGSIMFKIRTTAPEKYRVKPFSGTLAVGAVGTVNVILQAGYKAGKDKFLIQAVKEPDEKVDNIKELFKKTATEYKLKVSPETSNEIDGILYSSPKNTSKNLIDVKSGADTNTLHHKLDILQGEVKFVRVASIILIFMTIVSIIATGLVYMKLSDIARFYERTSK